MSEKEKKLVETLGKLPEPLQREFLAMAKGATMMLDQLQATTPTTGEETKAEGG